KENIFKTLLELIHEEYESSPDHNIVGTSLRLLLSKTSHMNQGKKNTTPEKYFHAQSYLEKNLNKPIFLKDLAKITNCSVPQFCVNYKKYFGLSAIQYLNNLRL